MYIYIYIYIYTHIIYVCNNSKILLLQLIQIITSIIIITLIMIIVAQKDEPGGERATDCAATIRGEEGTVD